MTDKALCFMINISLVGFVQAQSTFDRIYLSGANAKMNLIELPSHNVLAGIAWGPGVSLLDPDGNIIHTEHYWSDSILVQRSIRRCSENEFYFALGYQQDSCSASGTLTIPYTYPAIGKTDSSGNVLGMRHYRLNMDKCWMSPEDLEITVDKGVITWGGGGPGIQWSFFGLRVDSMGVPVWAKNFNRHGSFQFIKELPGGDLLAGINMDTAGAVVARMDPDGNFLWLKSYIRPRGMIHDAVIESDDSFIITGFTDSTASTNPFIPYPPTYHPKLFMMKVNGQGDVQWCKGYDSAPNLWYSRKPSRIVRTLDGHYAVLATLGYPQNNFFFRPFLMKTDLNGDTLWTRSMGATGYDYYTMDLLAYSDGGYMLSGGVEGDLPQMWSGAPFIFKTDPFGHFSCSEHHHPIQIMDLFPTDSSFVLTSVDGATVHPAFVSDTTFAPINVYNACTTTAVTNPMRPGRKFKVYPNPNTGRFTVEFPDPLMAESYYSVYDAMGRLLYQRPLSTGRETEDVDLSRFGRGTYMIRFTSPDGVQHERVVLE
jgi:hypothetical protein